MRSIGARQWLAMHMASQGLVDGRSGPRVLVQLQVGQGQHPVFIFTQYLYQICYALGHCIPWSWNCDEHLDTRCDPMFVRTSMFLE